VQGVPFFVINNRLALTGAREASAFLDAFEQAIAPPDNEGSACAIGPGGEPSC
jgi:predicted DsbA family dithiol-disulfide isomerase